ncbi:DUF4337 domain-containing protein [Blastochloris sulfoviridis]|uniref:DUF4337 domain-containing protein n=1 Tax=Blastochloris sulfoviridis TaxID=50712 RepID=A0A5M6I179_9HYPH|nr:DUF4337 domain-containing protein [Blastochloris sulfoviridis]KAA5601655.1 DUF4337 domain-containing protein [Blastochloris sulfoviridis]
MHADEATEFMEAEKAEDRFKRRCAVLISIFAMLLAITSLGGQNAAKEATMNNIMAANYFSFYQAKNIRQTDLNIAANEFELAWASNPALSDDAKAALAAKAAEYRRTAARYESEPDTGEGKKELMAKAREHEAVRDRAMQQDPYFDYAEALLQIAIVLISVAIVAEIGQLAWLGGLLGLVGGILMLNGYFLLIAIPGFG